MAEDFVIEMLHITKEFPGIKANDDITLQLRKGEVHALLGENGAGKSTLMSVLFGLYQPEAGQIRKNGKEVAIRNPNDANALGIGMVHQHFKLVECFSVLDNIILGVEPNRMGFLQKAEARKKVMALSEKYGLRVDPDALISDISVGMQQRVEILKMLYRDNEILIFDEPTAVLTLSLIHILLAAGAVSESNYARVQSGFEGDLTLPSQTLNDKLRASAAKQGIPLIEGNIHSSDVFYRQPSDEKPTYWEKLRDERGCLCVEMESFALFANAEVLGKNAACLLTISDSFVSPEITTAEQRQKSFTDMMKVALGAEY